MEFSKHVFVVFGLIELSFGIINVVTDDNILLPGDTTPPAKSLALLGGGLWSYAIICLGFACLAASLTPDNEQTKLVLGVAALMYNIFMVIMAGSRAYKGWIFLGNRSNISWHIGAIALHGTLALWFIMWILQTETCKEKEKNSSDAIKKKHVN